MKWRPCWFPKTMKRRPCCFPKPVLRELSSFRISKLLFVAIKIGIAADNVRQNALIQNCLGFWIWMWIPYQLNLDSRFQSLAGFRIPWAQICIPKPRTSDSKWKNSLYSRGILVILHAWGGIDCKTVRIFEYSSTREQSNKRSGTKLKRESETGKRRFSLASHARRACEASALHARKTLTLRFIDLLTDFEKKPDCFAV